MHQDFLKSIFKVRLFKLKTDFSPSDLTGYGLELDVIWVISMPTVVKIYGQQCTLDSGIDVGLKINLNISSVVEFQRWWVLKSQLFDQESTCHQGKIFKQFLQVMTVRQKVPISYFQSQFWMSKMNRFKRKKNYLRIPI